MESADNVQRVLRVFLKIFAWAFGSRWVKHVAENGMVGEIVFSGDR